MWGISHSRDFKVYSFANNYSKDLLKWAYDNKIRFQDIDEILDWAKKENTNDPPYILRIKKLAKKRRIVRSHMYTLHMYNKKKLMKVINAQRYLSKNYTKIIKGKNKNYGFIDEETIKDLRVIFKYAYNKLLYNENFWEVYDAGSPVSNETIRRRICSKIKICPYCDKSDISSSEVNVDHFLPQSKFPLLSIHWKNFVLACKPCNDSLNKGELCHLPVLHPFFDEINKYIKFEFKSECKTVNIQTAYKKGVYRSRAENFIEVMNLKERYIRLWPNSLEKTLTQSINSAFHKHVLYKGDYNKSKWERLFNQIIQENKIDLMDEAGQETQIKLRLDFCEHVRSNDNNLWLQHLEKLIHKRRELVASINEHL
ncbi:HNH endonuclease [Peribacillus frigoritolerans]|uniref:HNH endonuclease n=1 Tax=Peribacillus frigoritolerans TaxID=450367 RepID=UPI002B2416BF|nr:HNH endonuclease [Peribacillus frigoritolerans]MEB2630226.1 HNH endonuclease [Peribacillus frigoritolerans]